MIILIVVCSLSIAILWKFFSIWYGNRLRKDTARRKVEIERLKKEIYKNKEMKKHLGFHDMEKEVFEPYPKEEPSYDAIADEMDEDELGNSEI